MSPNVENSVGKEEIVDVDEYLNPVARYTYSEDELAQYLSNNILPRNENAERPAITDYKKDVLKPVATTFRTIYFAFKNCGKTHIINTMPGLNPNSGEIQRAKKKYNHLVWLMNNKYLEPVKGSHEICDSEGKGNVLKDKFSEYNTRYRPLFYENGPMPTMQDPVGYVEEYVLFMKAVRWAKNNPERYEQLTGLKAPDAAAFENYSILTNEIMNYVRTMSHDDKVKKLDEKNQKLGSPVIKKFDNWDIRNCNWDYIGGFMQHKMNLHYGVTARAKTKWKNSEPTDEEDLDLYSKASYPFDVVVHLYRDDATNVFYAKIVSSNYMDPGMNPIIIENPTYVRIMYELTKYSHRRILDKYGHWMTATNKKGESYEIWVENESKSSNETPVVKQEEKKEILDEPVVEKRAKKVSTEPVVEKRVKKVVKEKPVKEEIVVEEGVKEEIVESEDKIQEIVNQQVEPNADN